MANVTGLSAETGAVIMEERPHGPTRAFIKKLQSLGARVERFVTPSDHSGAFRPHLYAAFLSCDLETWIKTFGEPENVSEHYDLLTHVPFQAWQQPLFGDTVTCVGHLFERAPGRRWVTVSRVRG